MKKVIDLLEAHVQWLAMLMGVAFLGWTVYSYVYIQDPAVELQQPGKTKVKLTPGEVDPWMTAESNVADQVAIAMHAPAVPISPPPDAEKAFLRELHGINAPSLNVADRGPIWQVAPFAAGPVPPPQPKVGKENILVTGLPDVPAPLFGKIRILRSTTADINNPNLLIDRLAVQVTGSFDVPTLAANYAKVQLDKAGNGAFDSAMFARVQLIREELSPDGKWINHTIVMELPISALPLLPAVGNQNDEVRYKLWAKDHQDTIAHPAYYAVKAGDDPTKPEDEGAPAAAAATFDPNNPPTDRTLTPDEEKQVEAALAAKRAAAQKLAHPKPAPRRTTPSGTSGGPTGGPPPGGGHPTNYYPLELAQVTPDQSAPGGPALPPGAPPPGAQPPPGAPPTPNTGYPSRPPPGYVPPGGNPGAPAGVPSTGSPATPSPGGPFAPPPAGGTGVAPGSDGGNPAVPAVPASQPAVQMNLGAPWTPVPNAINIDLWAFDETAEANKTYRYSLKVVLVNPVYLQVNAVAKPAMANQLLLESPLGAWSAPITIPPPTRFFVTGGTPAARGGAIAQIVVFRWTHGAWNKKVYDPVQLGQMVGDLDATTNLDFSTGYMLVDVRPESGSQIRVVLADPNGEISTRNPAEESKSTDLQNWNKKVLDNKSALVPATPSGGSALAIPSRPALPGGGSSE